jgi:cobalt-zinc-cadmium resistance protein CzcA
MHGGVHQLGAVEHRAGVDARRQRAVDLLDLRLRFVVASRRDTPIHLRDVAEVSIGRDLRTGTASMNGRETVLGTVLMLVGGNSRTVAAVDTVHWNCPCS